MVHVTEYTKKPGQVERCKTVLRSCANVALLTGGRDKPYALGLGAALLAADTPIDFIGSNEVNGLVLGASPKLRFLNLRGDQDSEAGRAAKVLRVFRYYLMLIRYAATAEAVIFHILWNNKLEFFDRTVLLLYYRCLGKRIAFTAHNVNAGKRDANDSFLNRLTLRIQYRLVDHIFVHTSKAKKEMESEFRVPAGKISVIPFGINNTVPDTTLTSSEARQRIGVNRTDKTMLFFGGITPYKGLEYLVTAFAELAVESPDYRLIIAGRPKGNDDYWKEIKRMIAHQRTGSRIIERIEYIPDEETELYFKAADVLILPYTHIFQSGVLFLSYSFGLPVIAADVGSLKEDILPGKTGFVFKARDAADLAGTIQRYFHSKLYLGLEGARQEIRQYANEKYSWAKVATITTKIYSSFHGR